MRTYVCESFRCPTSITARPGRESSGVRDDSFSVSSDRTARAMDLPSMTLPSALLSSDVDMEEDIVRYEVVLAV